MSSPGVATLMMASAAANWNLRVSASRPAVVPLCLISASAASKVARSVGRAVAGEPLPDRQQRGAPDLPRAHREIALHQERLDRAEQETVPDRLSAAAPPRLPRSRARPCAIARARRWRRRCLRRARWRARTPASAAPAPEAGAGRDSPSAARSMSGSCARYGCVCSRTSKRAPPVIIKVSALRSRLGMMKSGAAWCRPKHITGFCGRSGAQTPGSTSSARNPPIGASPSARLPP